MNAIARLLPRDRIETLVGPDATEARVRADAGSRTVVHFATHGLVADDAPLDSFLVLARRAGDGADDGRLVPGFYKAWLRSGGASAALREAQLALIRALRRGELKLKTRLGEVTLPEHPALWAGIILLGEP